MISSQNKLFSPTVVSSLESHRTFTMSHLLGHLFPVFLGTSPSDAVFYYSPSLHPTASSGCKIKTNIHNKHNCLQYSSSLALAKKHSFCRFHWNPSSVWDWLHLHAKNQLARSQLLLSHLPPNNFTRISDKKRLATCWRNTKTLSLLVWETALVPVHQELVAFQFACFLLTVFIQVAQMGRIIWQAYL